MSDAVKQAERDTLIANARANVVALNEIAGELARVHDVSLEYDTHHLTRLGVITGKTILTVKATQAL